MRNVNSMSRCEYLGPNHAQLPDKGRAIKGLVVCNDWDLEPLDLLNGLALGFYQPSPGVLKQIFWGVYENNFGCLPQNTSLLLLVLNF